MTMNKQAMREKAEHHWGHAGLVRISSAGAIALGFGPDDARLLEEVGVPEWAAPNIWMHEPRSNESEFVLLGEDRDDRPIMYRKTPRAVVVGSPAAGGLYAAHDLASFLGALVLYADMVDAAIAVCGSEVFARNEIPEALIAKFEAGVLDACPLPKGVPSFWLEEVARLRSGRAA